MTHSLRSPSWPACLSRILICRWRRKWLTWLIDAWCLSLASNRQKLIKLLFRTQRRSLKRHFIPETQGRQSPCIWRRKLALITKVGCLKLTSNEAALVLLTYSKTALTGQNWREAISISTWRKGKSCVTSLMNICWQNKSCRKLENCRLRSKIIVCCRCRTIATLQSCFGFLKRRASRTRHLRLLTATR
jgi:hypothetical protein